MLDDWDQSEDTAIQLGRSISQSHPMFAEAINLLGVVAIADIITKVAFVEPAADMNVAGVHCPWAIHNR